MAARAKARRRRVYRRLSQSPLWAANRRYYDRAGIDAWRTGTVPHYITNNVPLATAYVRIVLGFLNEMGGSGRPPSPPAGRPRQSRDRPERTEPLHVIELGAGSGRFAFLFLRALEALERRAGVANAPIRYVMTDATDATIDFWRRHEGLAPFVRAGRLDFARFDAETDRTVRLHYARRTLAPGAPAARLVVIANYVLDGLRHDAFVVQRGRIHEYLAAAVVPRRGRAADVALDWRVGPRVTAPYAEDDFNALLRDHTRAATTGRMVFPVSALRCLDRLAALAREDLMVLAADRGNADAADAVGRPVDLQLARHGSVSLPVNFHAMGNWVERRGGQALHPSQSEHIHVAGFLLGTRPGGWHETRDAYEAAMGHGGPDELYSLRRGLTDIAERAGAAELLGLIRLCGYDPRTVAECIRPLWRHVIDAGAPLRLEIRDAALAAWANYYHLGEDYDLAFNLALLLHEARAYVDAHALFQESVRLYGEDGATLWNLGLCDVALGKPDEAMASFQRARRLAPDLFPAGLAVVKAGTRDLPAHSGRARLRRVRPVGGLGGRPEPPKSTDSRPSSAEPGSAGQRRRRRGSRR